MRAKTIEAGAAAAVAVVVAGLFIAFLGGLALIASAAAVLAALIAIPVLFFMGNGRGASKVAGALGVYVILYLSISTAMAWAPYFGAHQQRAIGEEVCADAGCFAVDKVDLAAAPSGLTCTLSWHLTSNDKDQERRFPGKGLELYLFDERGRTFKLPATANQDPLDVLMPKSETLHQSTTFSVASDSRQLFLAAKYRPYTFQSLLPGNLTLVSPPSPPMIRIL
jgi:hypothetical protein